jgi:heme exporter protein B
VTAYCRQVYAIFAKDMLLEMRTRDAVTAMVIFALLVLVTFNFTLDLRPELMSAVGHGVLWVSIVFAGTLGLGRAFAVEREGATLEGLLMAPVDRSAVYLAKVLSSLISMCVVEAVGVVAFVALFNAPIDAPRLLGALLLGTIGLGAVGTLLAGIAANTRAREVMLPLLLFPIIVPLLIGVVESSGTALDSAAGPGAPWLSLLAAFDLVYLAVGAAAFDYVLEE